jgi:hypothetical protein
MSMEALRRQYGTPIRRGQRVRYHGEPGPAHEGTIVAVRGSYLRVRMESLHAGGVFTLHPRWKLEYL